MNVLDVPGFAVRDVPPGIFALGGGEASLRSLEGIEFDDGNTSLSLGGGVGGRGKDASERLGRRNRPSSLIAEIGRGSFIICSRPVIPVLAGGGGAAVSAPVGVDGIFVCVVRVFVCVSRSVISEEFDINEA